MTRPNNQVIRTTFGTTLSAINTTDGMFILKEDVSALIDTPIEKMVGTKQTFLKGSVVTGTLWKEIDEKSQKTRNIIMVQSDDGRYLIPVKNLEPTTKNEIDSKSTIQKLGDKVEELLSKTKEEVTEVVKEPSSFLEKEYVGFKGKQILVAAVGVIILIKVFK